MDPAASKISKGALRFVPRHQNAKFLCDRADTNPYSAIFNDVENAHKQYPVPVLQCLQVKALGQQPGGTDRFRIVLSDLDNYVQAMLASQVNHLVRDEKIVRNCIVRVTQYQPNAVKGKK